MKKQKNKSSEKEHDDLLPGYPIYPANEDVYSKLKEEEDIDPENTAKIKDPNWNKDEKNEKDFPRAVSGSDLDIPGSEDDEKEENMGNEDEENNFYSLGGDDNNALEEDNQ